MTNDDQFQTGALGEEAWIEGMHPETPEAKVLENPYTYTYTPGL
jgi:hypothetical protein